jgi:myo-inositol-1(or 4)-monophosphatase
MAYEYERESTVLAGAVREAGAAIMHHFVNGAEVYTKADESPVTDADLAANTILMERLRAAFPDDAILSEEVAPDAAIDDAPRCWIIDPLDGTANFVRREPTFAVMVALEVAGRPHVGAIYHPATDELYAAVTGEGTTITRGGVTMPLRFPTVPFASARIGVSPGSFRTLTTGTPRWMGDPARLTCTVEIAQLASALDTMYDAYIGWIANGLNTGGYPWDLCATDLIVREAGGALTDLFGRTHHFLRRHERVRGGIVSARDASLHGDLLALLRTED